jgi:hypothetical protein
MHPAAKVLTEQRAQRDARIAAIADALERQQGMQRSGPLLAIRRGCWRQLLRIPRCQPIPSVTETDHERDPARAEHHEGGEIDSPAEHAERPTHAGYEGSGGRENECRFGIE